MSASLHRLRPEHLNLLAGAVAVDPDRETLDYALACELEEMGYLSATCYDGVGPAAWKVTRLAREEGLT